MDLPCGMRFHERLLLPNHGDEGATVIAHVASVYDNLPDAVTLLHGGKLGVWHAIERCDASKLDTRAMRWGADARCAAA